ncbi:MAG: hypothetical protein WDO14_07895 [Bacteroidota bacterium]
MQSGTYNRHSVHSPTTPLFSLPDGFGVHAQRQTERSNEVCTECKFTFDPHNADYFGLLAMINSTQKQWEDALTYANRGLQVDPGNLVCLNSRSTALLKLDRKEESYQTIKEALSNDPHNSHTHLILVGDCWSAAITTCSRIVSRSTEARSRNKHAKAGMVEALKARYWFYRVFLQYVFCSRIRIRDINGYSS